MEEPGATADLIAKGLGEDWRAKITDADIHQALERVTACCAPAPKDRIIAELAALWVLTKQREKEAADKALTLKVYAEKLSGYPADVVLHALAEVAEEMPWWPSWHELLVKINELYARRSTMRFRLEKTLEALERTES